MKIGSRDSTLARVQVAELQALLAGLLPGLSTTPAWFSSPGDRDQQTGLEEAPPDFFTRDLDDAVRTGQIDCGLHSAKDYPDPGPEDLDWFWLPCRHDTGDVLVGSASPRVIGVSSARRRVYAAQAFPGAELRPIRGTIERRLAQLDAGIYDALIMAGVALVRLGLEHRITQWVDPRDLPTPEGQGSLLVSFRRGDVRLQRLRSLFVRPVVLASAGTSADTCTVGVVEALQRAEVCLYDALLDPRLLQHLPVQAEAVYVGKRHGRHSHSQPEICALLAQYARMGRRVVRLKGGDAGLYARLAEEVDALDTLALPYRVLPGVSSMQSATTGTGLLLTRRRVTDRIHILSGHSETAHQPQSDGSQTEVIFMGTRCLDVIVSQRLACGYAPSTPVALVWSAGLPDEKVVCGTLESIVEVKASVDTAGAPGLILIGPAMDARNRYREHGALRGRRIWLTCSEDVQARAAAAIRDFGGIPVPVPLIRLVPVPVQVAWSSYDWLVVTSPAAVRCLLAGLRDLRCLPKILCCGPGTARVLRLAQIDPDAQPVGCFSTDGVLQEAKRLLKKGARVLRVRSDRAGEGLAVALRDAGFAVDDVVISRNEALQVEYPRCDAVLFASSSAVDAYLAQFGKSGLAGTLIGVMGHREAERFAEDGIYDVRIPQTFTLAGAVATMAGQVIEKELA